MLKCLGIFRELQNSPNRETDDALILKAVLDQLRNLGIEPRAVTPEEFDEMDLGGADRFDAVLPMCESYPRIKKLDALSKNSGILWLNPPSSVLACYRNTMVPRLSSLPDVRFPPSEIRKVAKGHNHAPVSFDAPEGWWIKRGDVHNTCDRDVVRANQWPETEAILKDFAEREIIEYVIQPHIDGDLIKFYSVGPGHWFTWFYHDPVRARRIPFDLDNLAGQVANAARVLELEIFGGDAIVSPSGRITVIDINSWPSFALVRQEAAVQISWHLQRKLKAVRAPQRIA